MQRVQRAEVGRIAALWRYPVKSMAGETLGQAEVSWSGMSGDRRWAFVREGRERSGFPWLTVRQRPDLWHYQPWFAEPDRPDTSRTMVHTPSGDDVDVADPALAAAFGCGVRVIRHNRGIFDVMPLSLITTQTVAATAALVDGELQPLRFRPNVLIEAADDALFPEDEWVGRVLRIGSAEVRVDQRDRRCVVVNVDPVTLQTDGRVLRTIVQERQAHVGVYSSIVKPGRIALGDPVLVC